jgi:PAS domain S-box-containing protein
MNESEKWQRRYAREKKARGEAERLLKEKSLALYQKTQELNDLVAEQKTLIAERTRDLKSVSEKASLLSDAVSRTANGVIITGPDNRVIWANQAVEKISGYHPEELIGKIPGHLLQGERSDPTVRDYMRSKVAAREPFEAEIINYHKNGSPYWTHLQATPVLDDSGKFKYFVAIQSDITEERATRERLEKESERSNKMAEKARKADGAKTKFLATMSHELRTPLNGIIGYAQILEKNTKIEEKTVSQIRIIRRSGEHLLSLINDLLDLSKIDAGSHKLTPSRFDLKGMLQSVVEITESKAFEKGLLLKLLYDSSGYIPEGQRARIYADPRAVRQVLINLIGNAIKFTKKGIVSLEVRILDFDGQDARVEFSVVDTGRGIPENKRSSLFKAFKQVDEERDVLVGSGLGLFIAQRLVQEMGDEIQVESTEGKGSCFSFKIKCPLDFTEKRVAAQIIAEEQRDRFPVSYSGPKRRLLIVDDIEDNRSLLIDLLQPIGFELDQAENGREALRKIKGNRYDMILSDVIMPFMSGYEMIKLLRSEPKYEDLCVIAVSASLMQLSAIERDEMKNFDGFIAKPVQSKELLSVISNKLGLTWVYSGESDEADRDDGNSSDQPVFGDGDDVIEKLHWLARIGDVNAIKQEIKAGGNAYLTKPVLYDEATSHLNAYLEIQSLRSMLSEQRSQPEKATQNDYRELDTIIDLVAHDMKSPLFGINGFSDELIADLKEAENVPEE